MDKFYKKMKNNNFIDERRFFKKYRTILKNWNKFSKLSTRLKKILTYRYDLKNNQGHFLSYKEVAKKFKMHRQTVYILEKKAFNILTRDKNKEK